MPEVISFEDLEEFAKKETLSKNQLRQLQSLHGDLDAAKGRLEAYFKKPPVTRSEIDEEIKAIQDAMAELLRTAKVKRIMVDPFVYALRKIRTHFKTISENKAIESLKKKKLGKFIKRIEAIDMGGLREYLIRSKVNIPGLRKIEDDVSIYIYKKHEEGYELVKLEEPKAIKDQGLPWHKIPKDQRLGDIHETIENLEPRKSDPFPEPVVEFIMENKDLSIEEIDEKLVKMIEDGDLPTWTMHISNAESYSKNNYPGIYLVHPHSELIHSGTKTAIVKSKKFDKHMNVPLYLISDDKCYGVIELSTPVEIDKKEFEERYRDHLIEDFERIEWWGEKFPLYLYNVKVIEKFEPVRKVDIPAGIQVWILPENVKFEE